LEIFNGILSYRLTSSSPSATVPVLEVTRQRLVHHKVHSTSEDFSFPKDMLIDGTSYIRTIKTLQPSIPSRTVYSSGKKVTWAFSRTSRSAWPIGFVCTGKSSSVKVWPHLVSLS